MYFLDCGQSWIPGEDGYIEALQEAQAELEQHHCDLLEWLEENCKGNYYIEEEYDDWTTGVDCELYLEFSSYEYEVAFKLAWPEYFDEESDCWRMV